MTPSPLQVLGCQVRAAHEAYERKHRKPHGGGWEVPAREETYARLEAEFGLSRQVLSYFFTYTRTCIHSWAAGACPKCPEPTTKPDWTVP